MNEDHSENHPADDATETSEPETIASESREAFKDLAEAAKEAFQAGTADAADAAKRFIPEAKSDVSKGVHDLAYGLAYAVSFGSTLLREITPDAVTNGFSQGSEAGKKAASDIVEKRKTAKETPEGEPSAA